VRSRGLFAPVHNRPGFRKSKGQRGDQYACTRYDEDQFS
jgi:hypothetical protein